VVEQAATPVLFVVEVWESGMKEMGTQELVGKRMVIFCKITAAALKSGRREVLDLFLQNLTGSIFH
jgi:hypothetical protein